MIVTYNGKDFCGFQKQNKGDTIQQRLEQAILTITKQQVTCVASGRTDAKVSAYYQPVHFDIDIALDTQKFLRSINGILPEQIKVLKVESTTIHARFSAKQKTYTYKMYKAKIDLPLFADALRIEPDLDVKAMQKFLRMLKGTHDFGGFKASGGSTENDVRTIYSAKLVKQGDYLNLLITGNGFLYKMVRNIVGTMLEVGNHKLDLRQLKPTLFTTFKATRTAKPEYLYLLKVKYN